MSGYSRQLRNRPPTRSARAFLVVLAALLLGMTACIRKAPEESNLVLAVVGEKKIRESDFRRKLESLDPTLKGRYRRDRTGLLDQMVEEEVIYQKAANENLVEDPEAQSRLAWARGEASIEQLKETQILKDIGVSDGEIRERYEQEVNKGGDSKIVRLLLYESVYEGAEPPKVISMIEKGFHEGLSFPEIAKRHELPYVDPPIGLDSPRFSQEVPAQIQELVRRMEAKMVAAATSPGGNVYFIKDVEPLSSCFRRIRSVIRDEKREDALRQWIVSRRAAGAIRIHDKALENTTDKHAVAAEVNGVAITVRQLEALQDNLAKENKSLDTADAKALVNKAIDREILRQEAEKRKLDEDRVVKETVARQTRRILVDLLAERNVTGLTQAVRTKSRTGWIEQLKKEVGVKVLSENVKKMALPPSEEIEEVFGTQPP